ncbi:M20 family metallo-hydrolase [Cryobacterium sp. 10I1]|uniref:M20 family metallo-hydrolase n=1 Tax=unclassified Cryobacterium TaxID=2649013 RepID=UPI002AC9D19A|nr:MULTISPECIES: M20 family metallo-hydrolase [unclassified Cryobacterium]MEB0288114.1 M20 family metallo-hydrolase [Cryobacterium sp. 10S3]MEB0304686.1 M20 family metallo-hydrolase [Cryobacterium sp. 10I1]WPX13083.1 M20 family metallo-hydrolase [Cryobacterium sp. 10S3]
MTTNTIVDANTEADAAALLADFHTMSEFGATSGGGVDRQAASAADGQTRSWFSAWLADRGFRVEVDTIGNIFGLLELVPGAPYVLFGSHLDSQPLAGRYDGAYGVLAAGHAAHRAHRDLAASGITPRYNIAVVDWFNEEGSRFKPSMMGSAVFTGRLDLEVALATTDPRGTSVREALDAIGGRGGFVGPDVAGYAEIHVEQGRTLEDAGVPIGVVASTWCAYKYEIVVLGEQSHTGSTLMRDRRDALLGASKLVVAINELVREFDDEVLHASVGEFTVGPNSPVTIAREVRLLADLRARESSILASAFEILQQRMRAIESETGVRIEVLASSIWESGPFLETGLAITETAAEQLGLDSMRVLTLAGHDATNLKETVPVILIFVPSMDGVSHNEKEFTHDTDLVAGARVLTEVVKRLALGDFAG